MGDITLDKIEVYNCKRFNSKLVSVNFGTNINVITGEIGSGKSTLMRYTTPLIVDKKDFRDGGYRKLSFRIGFDHYVIKNQGNVNSILKNNEELNVSLKTKGFKEIVLNEFKADNGMWDVLLMEDTFTEASFSKRKDWFNNLSNVDYDYPLKVFNLTNEKLRDYNGAKKLAIINLQELLSINLSRLNESKVELKNLDYEIEDKLKDFVRVDINAVGGNYKTTDDVRHAIKARNDALKRLKSKIDTIGFKSEEDAIKALEVNVVNLRSLESKRDILKDRMRRSIEIEDAMDKAKDINDIKSKIYNLKINFNNVINQSNYKSVIIHIDKFKNMYEDILNELDSLGGFKDIDINVFKANEEMEVSKLHSINEDINRISSHINMLKEASKKDSVVCPKCTHSFKDGLGHLKTDVEIVVKDNIRALDTLSSSKESVQINLRKHEKDITSFNRYEELKIKLSSINNIISINNIGELNDTIMLVNKLRGLESLENELNSIESVSTGVVKMEYDINSVRLELRSIDIDINNIKDLIVKHDLTIKTTKSIEDSHKEIVGLEKTLNHRMNNDLILNQVNVLRNKRKILEEEVNSTLAKENRKMSLEKDIQEHSVKIQELKLISDALSPKTGLIAKSINGFIGSVLDKMNNIVKNILDYQLEILPPQVDSGELMLDYKFPVSVNGEIVKDIKYLSSGQKELVNLAWLLVMHGVSDIGYPVYLDEFANRLDLHHKVKAFDFISKLSEDKQIMLITHLMEGVIHKEGSTHIKM